MAKQSQQQKQKLPTRKTESLTVRLDPKVKFGLELMSRVQNRTVTGVVEWALGFAMARTMVDSQGHEVSLAELVDGLWTTDEALRLAHLAIRAPILLTYDELRIWETIRVSPVFWVSDGCSAIERNVKFELLRVVWEELLEHVHKHEQEPTIAAFTTDELETPF